MSSTNQWSNFSYVIPSIFVLQYGYHQLPRLLDFKSQQPASILFTPRNGLSLTFLPMCVPRERGTGRRKNDCMPHLPHIMLPVNSISEAGVDHCLVRRCVQELVAIVPHQYHDWLQAGSIKLAGTHGMICENLRLAVGLIWSYISRHSRESTFGVRFRQSFSFRQAE